MPGLLVKAALIGALLCCHASVFGADIGTPADDGILLQQAAKAQFISVPGVPAAALGAESDEARKISAVLRDMRARKTR